MIDNEVRVGDWFVRLTDCQDFREGDVSVVMAANGTNRRHPFSISGGRLSHEALASADWLLRSGEWLRVPVGYVAPTVADCLATMRRLVASYRAMLADPETGRHGIDATVREMATLCGLEVTW
jgi:hypothetical protein